MSRFIGRESELKKLNEMYDGDRFEFAVVYGRRRVGKTTLIDEFCKEKKTIFFAAMETDAKRNLEALSAAVFSVCGTRYGEASFSSFQAAFDTVAELARSERLVFVIDEYPYLAAGDRSISSILQNTIDRKFKGTKLLLILCGSSMSFMENQVLGYQSPLYGRRTAQFKVLPFDYRETAAWFPHYSAEEKLLIYGITGGIPMYLEEIRQNKSVDENIIDNILSRNAMLFEEPSNLLKQELREPQTYNSIITAVADGKTKLSEISGTVGIESGTCTKYINNLITLGIIKRETPITESGNKSIYLIADGLFRFWYRFVPKNISAIMSGKLKEIYPIMIKPQLSDFMGLVFEEVCKQYLERYASLPILAGTVGQWWGGNPRTKKQAQIDIVVLSPDEKEGIVGSCKYKNEKIGLDELELLKDYASAMGGNRNYYYYIFSKSGFTQGLENASDSVKSVTLKELFD
ncbi:MAG: ATP-binding protein [Clostridiales bacterium]|jgi:AAA+ ATPase superfamily predicted ATPase|nr:ATP-binding protein [Clostridiales bacterium]